MRGVNLDVFEFDYDLQWMAMFVSADERVLGRYGGRLPDDAEKYRNLEGLRFAMQKALERHKELRPPAAEAPRPARTVEQYPATVRLPAKSCIHCHHVY